MGTYEESAECWESLTALGGFDASSASVAEGALTLSPSGSANALGFWTSPPLTVEGGEILIITWNFITSAMRENCPQFRFRVNEGGFRHADIQAVESNGDGAMSPGAASPRQYIQTYQVPNFSTEIRLAFDLLSFNPGDDLNAVVGLAEVEVEKQQAVRSLPQK